MKNKTFNFLIIIIAFIILDLIGLLLYAQNNFLNEAEKNDILPKISFPTEPLSTNFVPQKTNPEPNKIILQNIDIMTTIKENSPEEFDGKSWNEIFSTRISAIKQYQKNNKNINGKEFIKNYAPNEEVFGRIVDGKKWWGFNGIACTNKIDSTSGKSEESRFINNPLFLVGIDVAWAFTIEDWACDNVYPQPYRLDIIPKTKHFISTFLVSDFDENIKKHRNYWLNANKTNKYIYNLNGLNARDFGYEYVFVKTTKNIEFRPDVNNATQDVFKFKNYIHVGQSCGASGGCNNGSPKQEEVEFTITQFPAEMKLYLYKEYPKTANASPDLIYQIYLE